MRLKSFSLLKAFDEPSRFVEFVEAIWLFSAASVGYDRVRSTVLQLHAQLGAVICFVANQVFRCFASADEALGRRAVVCFASGQQDGEFAALVCSAFIGLTASTPQDDTSATCAEDLFTKCVSCRPRGRRCSYPIVRSEAAAGHATADLANNCGIAAPGSCVSGQR